MSDDSTAPFWVPLSELGGDVQVVDGDGDRDDSNDGGNGSCACGCSCRHGANSVGGYGCGCGKELDESLGKVSRCTSGDEEL